MKKEKYSKKETNRLCTTKMREKNSMNYPV